MKKQLKNNMLTLKTSYMDHLWLSSYQTTSKCQRVITEVANALYHSTAHIGHKLIDVQRLLDEWL